MLTSALTASAHHSALSELTSCVRTGYKEATKRTADAAYMMGSAELTGTGEYGRILRFQGLCGACADSGYEALFSATIFSRAWVHMYKAILGTPVHAVSIAQQIQLR